MMSYSLLSKKGYPRALYFGEYKGHMMFDLNVPLTKIDGSVVSTYATVYKKAGQRKFRVGVQENTNTARLMRQIDLFEDLYVRMPETMDKFAKAGDFYSGFIG